MNLRDFQRDCHDAILDKWRTFRSTLAVLATGLGKTIIFSHIINTRQPGRSLVLAHRKELIRQARDKIQQTTGLQVEVEMAESYANKSLFHSCPVVVGSVQTMLSGNGFKRMGRFKPEDFSTLIIDEAHHSTSDSYVQIIDYFKQNPNLKILGVTATPDRADKEALGQVFESVAYNYEILDGVENGWLVDVVQHFYKVQKLDFSECKTRAGDFVPSELAALMEHEEIVQGVCQPSLEVIHGLDAKSLNGVEVAQWGEFIKLNAKARRRTIVFTASVAQAEAACSVFNRAVTGIAEWVCGKTKDDKRKAILDRFANGTTTVVCNCGVLIEGFDNPGVEVIIMARPTKSRALYAQMIGRSTRPLPGIVDSRLTASERKLAIAISPKPYCRIVDFAGNCGEHRLMCAMDILGEKVHDEVVQKAREIAIEKEKPVRVCVELSKEEREAERRKAEEQELKQKKEEERKKVLLAKVHFTHHEVDAFSHHDQGAPQEWTERRLRRPLSEKQRKLLRRNGYNPDKMTNPQANYVIGMLFAKHPEWNNKKKGKHETNHHHGSAGSLTGEYLPDESTNPF